MKHFFSFCLTLLALAPMAQADNSWYSSFDKEYTLKIEGTDIQVGIYENTSAAATILYMPGFADTMDNHQALFSAARSAGFRVISFDYPGHGQSGGDIRWWTLEGLAGIAAQVLADSQSQVKADTPLILAGWSTGATIALRISQAWGSLLSGHGNLIGVFGIAPALPAKIVINVNKNDLTNGTMKHGPAPTSVPMLGNFAPSILAQSKLAYFSGASEIPTLLAIGGNEEDSFAHSTSAVSWIKKQPTKPLAGVQCEKGKHGLEFEPGGTDHEIIFLATGFFQSILKASKEEQKSFLQEVLQSESLRNCRPI